MRKLKISVGKVHLEVELLDTPTADAIFAAAPFESRAATWDGEVYFTIPVKAEREADARAVVELGELAYRVEGEAVVIAFAPTPASVADEIRLAAPENIWAKGPVEPHAMLKIEPGELVKVEPVSA
ncbi:cyclophilin-like family protein [Magnetospirillum sp. LM-5]|uniref:cyclophilin-like family protein n=1 Tax=Magnetospirillum sp. LM-5 TaxID=2681466 RepID=UPI00156D6F55|nr:cyclophilin-like family protein [Magnetospirillum sp. LM-5]